MSHRDEHAAHAGCRGEHPHGIDHGHRQGADRAHAPHHGHGHGHHTGPATFDRAFGTAIALNLGFVGVEAFYGWRVDSLALLADAGHNLSDVAGLVLAWGGAFAGRLRPDARHTYGWQRASILAAFANAVLLLVAMGALAWEAAHRLAAPQPMQGATIMAVARWEPRVDLSGAEVSVHHGGNTGVQVLLRAQVNGQAENFIIGV